MKVFIGSLPSSITEDDLVAQFEVFGTITSAVCNRDKRYGFITYSSADEAELAIEGMAGTSIDGASIVVKLADNQATATGAQPTAANNAKGPATWVPQAPPPAAIGASDRLYIKSLPAGITDQDLCEIFGPYTTVLDTKVLLSDGQHDDGTGQSVAIIKVGSPAEAQWCIKNLHGKMPEGLPRAVEISHAAPVKGAAPQEGAPPLRATVQSTLRPAFQPTLQPAWRPTLRFSPYPSQGTPAKPMPQPAAAPPPVAFQATPQAVVERDEPLVPGIAEQLQNLPPRSKLYIKGLPVHADDLYLYKAFAPFGCILTVKAIPNPAGYCIGFVTYMHEEEAAAAMEALNGQTLLDGTVLTVAIKTVKGG